MESVSTLFLNMGFPELLSVGAQRKHRARCFPFLLYDLRFREKRLLFLTCLKLDGLSCVIDEYLVEAGTLRGFGLFGYPFHQRTVIVLVSSTEIFNHCNSHSIHNRIFKFSV